MRYLYFLIIFLLFSCIPNAPHKNPLDPENPDATGTIKGEVITLFGSNPLPGALVHLFPGSHIDTTNSEGRFSFSPLQPNDYIVSVTKDMYISKADTVLLIGGEEKEIQFKLNGNLTIIDCSVYSVHSFDAYEEYEAVLTLTIYDPEVPFAELV
ncbi:MAG: carboxypeptidase regulatory-like domain-containing protein, partial [Candidatus Cloacimonadota bacterium]